LGQQKQQWVLKHTLLKRSSIYPEPTLRAFQILRAFSLEQDEIITPLVGEITHFAVTHSWWLEPPTTSKRNFSGPGKYPDFLV